MRNRIWLAAGGSVLAASIGLLGAATAASASTVTASTAHSSTVVGYTYIDGNTATSNTIDGFARHADGSVTPLPGGADEVDRGSLRILPRQGERNA